jgi:chemotaxis protein CheD
MSKSERRRGGDEIDGHLVRPGELALTEEGTMLISVVSLGVAVCLWERGRAVSALAHFVEPATYEAHRATTRFGNVAVPKLLELMREHVGVIPFEAQIFGGATLRQGDLRGEANIDMARKILRARGIHIASEDVGGHKGRKIMLDSKTGHVAVIKVHELREGDWNQ